MKKLIFMGLAVLILVFFGCSSQDDGEAVKKAPAQKEQASMEAKTQVNPLLTKDGLEKKLAEFGITPYPAAEFEKIKTGDDGYTISYILSDLSQTANDAVNKYYAAIYKKMTDDGWKRFDENHAIFSWHKQMIQFAHMYKPELKLHNIYISYGLME